MPRRPSSVFLAACLLALILGFWAGRARAERYALLIAVSEYRNPEAWTTLAGPQNDIPALHRALLKRGFPAGNISVLADRIGAGGEGIRPAGLPTRSAILAEFARIAATVHEGDQLFVLLSGHGDEQATGRFAPNGRPEVEHAYVPIDGGPASGPRLGLGPIENGILHTDIGAFLDRLRASKSEAWVVIDTCHSGGLSRNIGPPGDAPPTLSPEPARPAALGGGGVVAFMSAQKSDLVREVTEVRVDTGAEPAAYGPLSLLVARILASDDASTYAEAARRVLVGYEFFRRQVWQPTMPLFEGDLERPIFADARQAAPMRNRWAAVNDGVQIRIEAGRLEGLQPGRELLIYGSASERGRMGLAAPDLLGRVTIERAELSQSFARLAAPGAVMPTYLLAEPAEPLPPTLLRLAVPAAMRQSPWLPTLAARLAPDRRFTLVTDPAAAEFRLEADAAGIWLLPADSTIQAAVAVGAQAIPSGEGADRVAEAVHARLEQAAQREHLLRLTENAPPAGASRFLQVELHLLRAPEPGVAARCTAAPEAPPGGAVPIVTEAIPDLRDCDTLYLQLANKGRNPLDLGLCFIDGTGRVQTADSLIRLRLGPGERLPPRALQMRSWDPRTLRPSAGPHRLVILAVERRDPTSLSFPLQISAAVCPRTLQTRPEPPDGPSADERSLLATLATPNRGTRQVTASGSLDGTVVRLLRWNQLPMR